MLYVIFSLIIIIIIILVLKYSAKASRKKKFKGIRSVWGQPKTENFYFGQIERYEEAINASDFHLISKQTITDVDFYDLFEFIDRTTSRIGQQFLFSKLKRPSGSVENLHKLNTTVNLFINDIPLREKIQYELLKLNNTDAYYVSTLLQGKLLERPWWFKFVIINTLVIISLLLLTPKFPVLLIFLIIPVTVNMLLHYWNKNNTFQFIRSFPQLSLLIFVANKINNMVGFENKDVKESIFLLNPFKRKLILLSLGQHNGLKDELNQIVFYFSELIKAFFLIELFALFHLTRELENKKNAILTIFNYVGEIDASISIASLRAGKLNTCQPEFIESGKQFSVKNIDHPLIVNCVTNDLVVNGKSVLITGSNMSGKTTLLRTLIINSILSQTIYTCFADEFKTPILKQFSSIRIDDSLLESKSYYFQEVNIMGELINEVVSRDQNLFILDEVFKGTNTVERIASAKAILSYLNTGNNIVIVSTHDIELADMLKKEYDQYHFRETIEGNQLHFDHKMKVGPLTTRNAIRILQISNYPESIIAEANALSENFGRL